MRENYTLQDSRVNHLRDVLNLYMDTNVMPPLQEIWSAFKYCLYSIYLGHIFNKVEPLLPSRPDSYPILNESASPGIGPMYYENLNLSWQ